MRALSLSAAVLLFASGAFADTAGAGPGEMIQWIRSGDAEALGRALKSGAADANAPIDAGSGMTMLHLAILSNSYDAARVLIEEGADLEAEGAAGTPLHTALSLCVNDLNGARRESMGEIIGLLLERGANAAALNELGDSPLNIASSGRNVEFCLGMARMLVERGAAADTRNDFGLTPLHDAFTVFVADDAPGPNPRPGTPASRAPLVAFLIASGADVNASNMDGDTPLFYALRDAESMELLLDAGARYDVKNRRDETPLDIALREGYDDAARALILRIGS